MLENKEAHVNSHSIGIRACYISAIALNCNCNLITVLDMTQSAKLLYTQGIMRQYSRVNCLTQRDKRNNGKIPKSPCSEPEGSQRSSCQRFRLMM